MAYKDLREFIEVLEKKGLLTRIRAAVDPEWEINSVTSVVTGSNGPAVLFENVKGTTTPVLSELFGRSWRRVALAMNMDTADPLKIRNEWMQRLENPTAPKVVKTGPCKEDILIGDKANLDALFPKVRWHEQDGGYYLGTLGMQVTADAATGEQNVGCYRMMYDNGVQLKLMMQPFQGGAQHLRLWGKRHPGKPMPMAVTTTSIREAGSHVHFRGGHLAINSPEVSTFDWH